MGIDVAKGWHRFLASEKRIYVGTSRQDNAVKTVEQGKEHCGICRSWYDDRYAASSFDTA